MPSRKPSRLPTAHDPGKGWALLSLLKAISERHVYYDKEGRPLTTSEWGALFEDMDYRRIAEDLLSDRFGSFMDDTVRVSTVWLGLDHGFGVGPPLIFETMIFGGEHNEYQMRYSTEEQARIGHQAAINLVTESLEVQHPVNYTSETHDGNA